MQCINAMEIWQRRSREGDSSEYCEPRAQPVEVFSLITYRKRQACKNPAGSACHNRDKIRSRDQRPTHDAVPARIRCNTANHTQAASRSQPAHDRQVLCMPEAEPTDIAELTPESSPAAAVAKRRVRVKSDWGVENQTITPWPWSHRASHRCREPPMAKPGSSGIKTGAAQRDYSATLEEDISRGIHLSLAILSSIPR